MTSWAWASEIRLVGSAIGLLHSRDLFPRPGLRGQPALAARAKPAVLLHEDRHARRGAAVDDRIDPSRIALASVRAALPADHHPANAGTELLRGDAAQVSRPVLPRQVLGIDLDPFEKRFEAEPVDRGRAAEERSYPLGPRGVLDAHAQVDDRQRPARVVAEQRLRRAWQRGAVLAPVRDALHRLLAAAHSRLVAHLAVVAAGRTDPAEPFQHPVRPLREHLERVLWAGRHHAKDSGDVLVRHLLVEEVRHRVDEDALALPPAQRRAQYVGHGPHLARPAGALLSDDRQAAVALLTHPFEPVGERLGVAPFAARRAARAADDGVPDAVRPADVRVGHQTGPPAFASAFSGSGTSTDCHTSAFV